MVPTQVGWLPGCCTSCASSLRSSALILIYTVLQVLNIANDRGANVMPGVIEGLQLLRTQTT